MIVDEGKTNQSFATNKVEGETMNWKDELKKKAIGLFSPHNPTGKIYVVDLPDAESFIESLLKEQREICANELDKNWVIGKETKWQKVLDIVLNAPEPGDKK